MEESPNTKAASILSAITEDMKGDKRMRNVVRRIYLLLLTVIAPICSISAQEFKVDTINSIVDTVQYLRIVTNDKYFPKKEIQIPMYLVADIRFIHRDKLPTPVTDTLSVADFHMESKTLWSGMNVGAKRSWESGALFKWGDTTPMTADQQATIKRRLLSLNRVPGIETTWTIDGKTYNAKRIIPGSSEDAATQAMGKDWRIPSVEQLQELASCCESNIYHRKKGVTVMELTHNGTSILLPYIEDENGDRLCLRSNVVYTGADKKLYCPTLVVDKNGKCVMRDCLMTTVANLPIRAVKAK